MLCSCKLSCTVTPGMFRGEYVAKLNTISPSGERKDAHVFVNEICLENIQRNHALLKATTVSNSKKGVGVLLPQPTFENGPYILVPKESLVK